jgi:ankyrin repeat protein
VDEETMKTPNFEKLVEAIIGNDWQLSANLIKENPFLATALNDNEKHFDSPINHWFYLGDTALHLAAAGYRIEIAEQLLDTGADPNAMANRRKSTPLHYASDGYVSDPIWDENRQVQMISRLLEAGADIHWSDKNGATPLHRAVRTRCAAAVKCLLDAGSNPHTRNKSGSTPFHLAVQNTGRGGSGENAAIEGQKRIILEFLSRKISVGLRDGKCKTVLESAQASWIRDLLLGVS